MKTTLLAVVALGVVLAGCDGSIGDPAADGPVAAGGAAGAMTSGTGGAGGYVPDPAPDCTPNADNGTDSFECRISAATTDKSGSSCLYCGGIDPPPPGGCALRPGPGHPGISRDVLCVSVTDCSTVCAYFWP